MIDKKQRNSVTSSLPSQSSDKSSLYWSARGSIATSKRRPSTVRQNEYIDPWDLENYVYIHRNAESSPNGSLSSDWIDKPNSPMLYYQSGSDDNLVGCYAGFDEELFYNAKYESIHEEPPYNSSIYYTDLDSSSTENNSGSTVSTLQLHTPGFGARASGGRIVLPKPIPQIEFPAPPPISDDIYYQNSISQDKSYCSFTEPCYDCYTQLPNYEEPYMNNYSAHRFGLSKKGLLQIDHLYNLNWNNLDRFIAK